MFNKNILLVIVFALIWFINVTIAQDNNANLIKTFETKWLEYLHSLGNVEGIIHYQYKANGKVNYDFTNEFVCSYPLLIDNRGDYNNYNSAEVFGKDYQFSLTKPKDTKQWIINTILYEPADKKLENWSFPVYLAEPPSYINDRVGYNIFNTLGVGLFGIDSGANLPFMISKKEFSIKEFHKTVKNGIDGYILNFEFSIPDFPEAVKKRADYSNHLEWKNFSLNGKLFLTTDYFLISEGEFHLEYLSFTQNANVSILYDIETYKTPLPKNYSIKIESNDYQNKKNNKNILENLLSFDLRETNPKNTERFTLSHYGLPEPDFGERRTNRVRYIIIGIGILMMAISAWRMIQKRRERN
jgi:hypothetical protein